MLRTKNKKRKKGEIPKEKEYLIDGIPRHPRPLGFTYACILAQKQEDKDSQQKSYEGIKDRMIELYINNNMEWNNRSLKISEFASYLGMKSSELLLRMNKEVERIGNFFDNKEGQRFARVVFLGAIKKGLEIQALAAHQTSILMAQQGDNYVAFLTGEVNRSLGNLINAQKPIHDLLKMLTEKQVTNILINLDKQSETSAQHYLSPEQAMIMIQEAGPSMYQNKLLIEDKEKDFELKGGLPDVNARNQDLSSIGVRIPHKELNGNDAQKIPNEVLDSDDFIA